MNSLELKNRMPTHFNTIHTEIHVDMDLCALSDLENLKLKDRFVFKRCILQGF